MRRAATFFILGMAACGPVDSGGMDAGEDGSTDTGGETGTGTTGTDTTETTDGGGTETGAYTTGMMVDYQTDIVPIWTKNCSCHGGGFPDAGLDLFGGADLYVGVASKQLPSMNLIEPGSPDDSYLWHKLLGDEYTIGGTGSPMPAGRPHLPNETLQYVYDWINQGAPP